MAELSAAVLMHLYGLGDRTGNCWRYIAQYASDPLIAVVKALNEVEQVLAFLLSGSPAQGAALDGPETW